MKVCVWMIISIACSCLQFGQIQGCEYPGVVPYERGKQLFPDRELGQEERSVRGTLVRGLTLPDIGHLDVFEGDVSLIGLLLR